MAQADVEADTGSPGRSAALNDALLLAFVLVIGLLASGWANFTLRENDKLRARALLDASSQSLLDTLNLEVAHSLQVLRSTALQVEAHAAVGHAQFADISQRVQAAPSAVRSLQWLPVSGGTALDPLRNEAALRARVIGQPVASATASDDSPGQANARIFYLVEPVYQHTAQSQDGQMVTGYVSACVPLQSLLADTLERADAAELDLELREADTPGTLIWRSPAGAGHTSAKARESHDLDRVVTLDVANRSWLLTLHPRAGFYARLPASFAMPVLFAGLFATLVLVLAIARVQSARRRVQRAQVDIDLARETLNVERQRLQNIIEGTDVGTWEYDFRSHELHVNERYTGVAGYAPSEFGDDLYHGWQKHCHPDDLPRVHEAMRRHYAGETRFYECEFRLRHKKGHWVWVTSRAKVLERDALGRPLLIAGTNLEITDRKQAQAHILELNATLEQRVQERSAQLEQAMQTLRRSQEELTRSEARATLATLVASVTHELSTPMGNSMMTASTLEAQAQDFHRRLANGPLRRSELDQFVQQVQSGSQLLLRNQQRAVELLTNFRHVAADQASEQRRRFDLRQTLQEVLDTLAPSLKNKPHRVQLQIAEGISMDSYPGPLGQVAINLINNAYLHAFDGMDAGLLHIDAQVQDDTVTLRFSDNGKGIAADVLGKMFEPFFSTKIGKGGTGLGMSIVENLVHTSLGGKVQVESTLGTGTCVTIALPRTAPMPAGDPELLPEQQPH